MEKHENYFHEGKDLLNNQIIKNKRLINWTLNLETSVQQKAH